MKYSIEGFSQSALLDHELELRDALFLRWFADFQQSKQMRVLVDGDDTYYWIRYAYVIEQIPILGLATEDSVRHYLRRLSDSGVIHKQTSAQGKGRGARAYYRIDPELWRDLTEKIDHRTDESGEHDHRTDESGSQSDQRTSESGSHDEHRTEQSGEGDDQRTDESGSHDDHRTGESGQIPPSENDSSNRGEDRVEQEDVPTPPPPQKKESPEKGIDPVNRVQAYIRHYVPQFWIRDQAIQTGIRSFAETFGDDVLAQVTKNYVKAKSAKQINNYFAVDFQERMADMQKALEQKHAAQEGGVCDRCKRRSNIIIDWESEQLCPDCARIARDEAQEEKAS